MQDRINELFPNSQVQLIRVGNKIIVRGQARDAKEATDIMNMVGTQRNRYGRDVANRAGLGQFGNASAFGNGAYVHGQAYPSDPQFNDRGPQEPGQQPWLGANRGGQLINLLYVPGVQQVMLKVRIAELSRQSGRDLGTDIRGLIGNVALNHVLEGVGDFTAILDGADVSLFLRAFASHGYGKILAEPTLVTISGKPARFLAGGEFAVPTTVGIDGVGAATTSFRGFGTELEFTPTVLDKDLIRLEVNPSFSSLNNGATVNGIPGLNKRTVETTVDLREGQWLAIAGLILDEQGGSRSRLPYLGDLQLLGGLFGNQTTSRDESELIVLVSPELVHPMEPEEVPLQLPGMEVTDPTDDDFFRRHLIEGYAGFDHRSTVWPEITAQRRGMQHNGVGSGRFLRRAICQDDYVCGPCGLSN